MIFGSNGNDFVALYNNEYAQITIPSGFHVVFVRSTQGDKPYTLPVTLSPNEKKCFKAYANPENYAKALLPIAYLFGNTFRLTAISCPTKEELAKYSSAAAPNEGQ
jgi:hypothetical protein